MHLRPTTMAECTTYWTDSLGVPADAFETDGVAVGRVDHGEGVQVFSRADAVVVGAPPSLAEACRERREELAGVSPTDPDSLADWVEEFVAPVETVLGPAFYGYTDESAFGPVRSDARVVTAADEAAYDRFRRSVPDDDWDAGGPAFEPGETVGLPVDGEIVAASGYDVWDGRIAHIGVVTHPDHRSAGNGRSVVSRATERALDAGLRPQYRTLDAWPWSVALAEGLGFERFGTGSLVVVAD